MKRLIILSVVYMTFALVGSASAVPVWQTDPPGVPPTTYQMWTFDDDDNPAPPEVVANAYGTPLAKLSGRPCRSLDWDQSYKGREGVWHADTVELAMEIPNRQVLDGYKEIWVEAIFRGYLDGVSVSENPQGTTVIPLGQTITALDKHWKRLNIGWRLEPNPYSEIVYLSFRDSGGCIDSVIVETNCVPEPATLLLLSLGGLALLRKRRTQTHLLS